MNCRPSNVVTSSVGPFSLGPMVITAFVAFPIAFAMASGSWKVDSTALRRLDSSVEITYKVYKSIYGVSFRIWYQNARWQMRGFGLSQNGYYLHVGRNWLGQVGLHA